ncbi:acriflavine resistance protein B [Rufibacter radiotolerans]|uniref:Acriflavine resistance protein B n=1 Tax=Rufibacter radiotolerans TaxID=1379910 RepID=A0A0H4VSE4_9BACT|nr:efflux RND transporter permease subunit [Rufibacter radiotolerans]AKQ46699.1 acriflavine resistance protein B [Rufibacter radiotolerans]
MKDFFLRYKNPVTVILTIVLAGGVFAYTRMQTSLFPEVTFPKIKVIADSGLQPVSKMMITVTKPLENTIKQVPDLHLIRSVTSRGSCEISAFMDWNVNVDLSKQQVESAIADVKAALPPGTDITVAKMNPSILPVMGYVIDGPGRSPIELNLIANYTVKPFISQVEGVSEVRVTGGKTKEFVVELEQQKMSSLGLTPTAISDALSHTNFLTSNGYLSDYDRLYLSTTNAAIENLDDLQNLVISNDGKRIVRLKDIAQVKVEEQVEYIRINANGKKAILIAVLKQPNSNLIAISNSVEAKVKTLNNRILPKGVRLTPYYIQADFVHDSIRSVTDSLLIGLLLAILVTVIFLRSLKSSIVILVTIPLTLSLTLIIMYVLGYTFNIMTLGAIAAAIGLIIDDAIVVVEQIHRTHEEHPETPTRDLLSKSVRYLLPAMVGSSMTTIVIFFPFVLLSGVAGAYFKILTNTMIITLVCSFLVTWLGLPVVYLLLSGKSNKVKPAETQKPGKWIAFFMHHSILSISFTIVLIGVVVLVAPLLETGFLPEMDEGSIVMDYTSPPGTSLDETDRMLRQAEKIIVKVPEVESYSRRTGTQMGFFITEPNSGDYLIQLKKDRQRSTNDVIDEIRKGIETTQPALVIDFGQVIGDMLGDLMSSTQPIEVKVYGDNQQLLQKIARQVASITEHVKGTADVFDGIVIAGPSVNIRPDNQLLARYQLTPADFQFQLQAQLEGNVIGNIFEKEQQTNVRLKYPYPTKTSLNTLENGQIFLPNGKLKPISELATIQIETGSAEIERENLQSMIPVTARLDNRDLGSTIAEIQQKINEQVHLPKGYHIDYGGAYQEQQQSFSELLMILVAAALLVFATILFLFREVKVAFLIICIAILGIAGSLLALYLTGTALNVGSYTGLIMIIGIIAENAIFTFLQFQESRQTSSMHDAIVYAISTRLRPKLMTAFGAIIALMPIALGIGTGAQLHQPLAIAVIGGFIIALPLLLIVYPTYLLLLFREKEEDQENIPL